MKVFMLGATGTIGAPLLDELLSHGHKVLALARSNESETILRNKGAEVVRGDLHQPQAWAARLHEVEAVIQAAATFGEDMGAVDRAVIEALLAEGMKSRQKRRFLYTGGCWLYGETGDLVASEETPFDPLPAFAWMIENAGILTAAPCFDVNIIHPAMVYTRDGGVLSRFLTAAKAGGPIEVWGSLETRWPVVHAKDLAKAYRLVLEGGIAGESYNVACEEGVQVARIVTAIARRFGVTTPPIVREVAAVVAEQGAWAAGPVLDQQMSGQKITTQLGWQPKHRDVVAVVG